MKKVLIAVAGIIFLVILFNAAHKTSKTYLENKQKTEFMESATAYLEQKYGIKIESCTDYFPGDISYHAPALGIDGGYFSNAAMHGTFIDSTGKEIKCTSRDGNLSDDYEEDILYKNFYDCLSEKLGVEVKYVSFDNCGHEVVYVDGNENYVDKNIYLFLEKSTKRYANMNVEIFFNDLLGYFDSGNMNIYALETDETQDNLMQNTETFKNGTDLNGVYVYMYDKNTNLTPEGKVFDTNYLYKYKYWVICNETGTRILENER